MGKACGKISVLIVDDSAFARRVVRAILESDEHIEVVGEAEDAYDARAQIKARNPDVLTLDIEMPHMDGISFLKNLMRLRPMPVVMVSSITDAGSDATLRALELGAVDFVPKPSSTDKTDLQTYAEELLQKVRAAAQAHVEALDLRDLEKHTDSVVPALLPSARHYEHEVIAIGASTGGTEAIQAIVKRLPPDMPGTVIVQHIPQAFSGSFANRLNAHSALNVVEARDGQAIESGCAYVAPGNKHLRILRTKRDLVCTLDEGPAINRHRPSVDALFHAVANCAGRHAMGVLLTGMGQDGARGLKAMRDAGGLTLAQDERTSVVWGMPREAANIGAADHILSLDDIADSLAMPAPARTRETDTDIV